MLLGIEIPRTIQQPGFWMRNGKTRALIKEIHASANSQTPVVTLNDGHNNGTYVVKERVFAAYWVCSQVLPE